MIVNSLIKGVPVPGLPPRRPAPQAPPHQRPSLHISGPILTSSTSLPRFETSRDSVEGFFDHSWIDFQLQLIDPIWIWIHLSSIFLLNYWNRTPDGGLTPITPSSSSLGLQQQQQQQQQQHAPFSFTHDIASAGSNGSPRHSIASNNSSNPPSPNVTGIHLRDRERDSYDSWAAAARILWGFFCRSCTL